MQFKNSKTYKQTLTEKEIQRADRHMKRCSISLAIRKMQIKTTGKFQATPIRRAKIKNSDNSKHWQGCSQSASLLYCWWDSKCIHSRNSLTASKKKIKTYTYHMTSMQSWEFIPEILILKIILKNLYTNVYSSFMHNFHK